MTTPANGRQSSFTVTSGIDLLEEWAGQATPSEKNIVHRIIFAVADRTVFAEYNVIDDAEDHMEYFVVGKGDLVVKIRIEELDSFAILYIGHRDTAAGFDAACSASVSRLLGVLQASNTPQA